MGPSSSSAAHSKYAHLAWRDPLGHDQYLRFALDADCDTFKTAVRSHPQRRSAPTALCGRFAGTTADADEYAVLEG